MAYAINSLRELHKNNLQTKAKVYDITIYLNTYTLLKSKAENIKTLLEDRQEIKCNLIYEITDQLSKMNLINDLLPLMETYRLYVTHGNITSFLQSVTIFIKEVEKFTNDEYERLIKNQS